MEIIAYLATIWGALIATFSLVFTIKTYNKASNIELFVSQKKELFNALTGLHHYVSSLRDRIDDYVESKAFKQLLLQCDGVKKILIENEYSAGKADKLIQKIIQDFNQVATDWENSIEEEKDLNVAAAHLMNKYFSSDFDKKIIKAQELLR